MNLTKKGIDNNKLIDKVSGILTDFSFDLQSRDGQTEVARALNKSVLLGGKRLRPLLTYLFSNLVGIQDGQKKELLCKSIEFVHAASLAHDDVIDCATIRRGNPSINIVVGNKKSILAGDFLLADVIQELSSLGNVDVLTSMSKTIKDLSLGEWLQHDLLTTRKYVDSSFVDISKLKTSSVLSWCAVGPMYFIGAPSDIISVGYKFGENIGIGFQLIDDVLDFKKSSDKDLHLDLKNNQLTSVTYHYLKTNGLLEKFISGEKLTDLVDLANINLSVEHVKKDALNYLKISDKYLTEILGFLKLSRVNPSFMAISFLVNQLRERVK